MFIPTSRDSLMDGFYLTFFSNSSMNVHPNNKIAAFAVQLAHERNLGINRWKVRLCEFSCSPPEVWTCKPKIFVGNTHALIHCALINQQFVSVKKAPCIRTYIRPRAFCNNVFKNVNYMSVERRRFRDIRI